jgi:hypothetical protein
LVCGAILTAVIAYFTIAIPAYRKGLKMFFLGSTEENEDRLLTWK